MPNEISFNPSELLLLNSDIRISSISTFNAQEAYENTFEDILLDEVSQTQELKQQENKVKFYNLGMPAGFVLDVSLLSDEDKMTLTSI